jgi:type VI secretion system protein ImpL
MQPMSYYMIAALSVVSYTAITWILVDVMGLSGRAAFTVRIVLMALGILAGGLWLWWKSKRGGAAGGGALPAEAEMLEPMFRDAEAKLAASRLGKEARLGTLPLVLALGDEGSAKSSTIVNSGLDAELLAGHVYQEGYIVPTRAVNLWFARDVVVVEAGGKLIEDAGRWTAILRRLQPARLKSLFGGGRQAPRSVVVFVDAERFVQPGAQEATVAIARRLNARLGEVSRALGVQLPVYVLFTRCDRIPFFTEYVSNLSDEEARQVVGVTVPLALGQGAGVYAEEETRRLTLAMQDLFLGLADYRSPMLKREHNAVKLPGIYEFPREFRKMRQMLVQFTVELCRPSQLQTSPYLRGLYFAGVRPVEVREAVRQRRQTQGGMAEATGVFTGEGMEAAQAAPSVQVRRLPQWVFTHRLFNEVILRDQAAFGASARSVGTDMARRLLLGGTAALALLLMTLWTVSFFKNRGLQAEVRESVQAIGQVRTDSQNLAPADALRRLEALRQNAELLSRYGREGAPWGMRWGLYTGDALLPTVRRLYFGRFHQLLFGQTQGGLLDWMKRLPLTPGPSDDYQYTYDTLKGYLITTSHHDKSTKMFLPPLLMNRWAGKQEVDDERKKLSKMQFDFYSDELKIANPFTSENDAAAIEKTRKYLAQFAATERIYQYMLSEAGKKCSSINFNRQFPGSASYVVNNKEIAGAFTKAGWVFMEEAITKKFDEYFAGEEWVLGPQAAGSIDRAKIQQELLARYRADFIGNWREYIRSSAVVRYANLNDAVQKLGQLSGTQSYLLALICVASENTSAATVAEVKDALQPAQHVTPAGCTERYIGGSNQMYMNGLLGLQASLEQAARANNPQDPAVGQTLSMASQAKQAARQVAQGFRIDKEGRVDQMVQKLLEDPITYVENLLGRLGPAQVNGAARQFCMEFGNLVKKYPFDTNSKVDATIEEVNSVFRPQNGTLWVFYEATLKSHLVKQGSEWAPNPASAGIRITPAFLRFFNRASSFSDALYKNGAAQEANVNYTIRALSSEGIQRLTLRLDGQELKSTGAGGQQASFTWPGRGAREARLAGSLGGPELGWLSYDGLWAVFRLFAEAERWQPSGSGFSFEWVPKTSGQPMRLGDGRPLTVRYFLDMGTSAPIFQRNYLAGFQCVSQAAQ